jgi:hypothetical protein
MFCRNQTTYIRWRKESGMIRRCLKTCSLVILIATFSPPVLAQHNPGLNCFSCHSNFRMAGTVFSDTVGTSVQPGISVALIRSDGSQITLSGTNDDGNIAEPVVPNGNYLVQIGSVTSRTWHNIPAQGSCNTCHRSGGNEGGSRTKRFSSAHTRIPSDNDCTHCHHFPATMAFSQLFSPYVLHTQELQPMVPGSQVDILGQVFRFEAEQFQISTLRPDVFAPGYYSMFDVILAVAEQNGIRVEYTYDNKRKTHFITEINNIPGDYWYHYSYDAGTDNSEEIGRKRAHRWDEALWRPGVWIKVVEGEDLDEIKDEYLEEIQRETAMGHVIPYVIISLNPSDYQGNPPGSGRITITKEFTNVLVTPHNLRSTGYASPYSKPFQPGVTTSLDLLLSLVDQGELTLTTSVFFTHLAGNYIESYFVVEMGFPEEGVAHASGSQGFAYTTDNGTTNRLPNDADLQYHITCDIAVLHAPDFSRWRWVELGNPFYERPRLGTTRDKAGDPAAEADPTVNEDFNSIRRGFNLHAPYPNPFNGTARITFNIFDPAFVRINVFDQTGQEVATLYEGMAPNIGIHETTWSPGSLASGTYYVVMSYNGQTQQVRRITYLK